MKKRILFSVTFVFILFLQARAQEPFRCDGSMFVVSGLNPRLYRVTFDFQADTVNLTPLANPVGFPVTAIGYSKMDNFVYGAAYINKEYHLCRIDSTGQGSLLRHIPLDTTEFQGLFGCDVTIDGRHLVFFVAPRGSILDPNICIVIDLFSPTFELETVVMSTLAGAPHILTSDIVYHPILEKAFGYDEQGIYNNMPNLYGKKTVIIDPFAGLIDNQVFFNAPENAGFGSASLFVTPFGKILGLSSIWTHTGWQELDPVTGSTFRYRFGEFFNFNPDFTSLPDGCSCPYTLAMEKTVSQDSIFGCTEVAFTYRLSNLTESQQESITFRDSFPPGFEITEVLYSGYTGSISGLGTNVIEISDLALHYGIDSIVLTVWVPQGAEGTHYTQALLSNVDLSSTNQAASAIRSDFPPTVERWDATPLTVIPLEITLASGVFELCPDSSLLISPFSDTTGLAIQWSDGTTGPSILVAGEGNYSVTVSGGCEKDSANFSVVASPLSVFLGDDLEGHFGDIIPLNPDLTFLSPIQSYYWETAGPSILFCDTCLQTEMSLLGNTVVSLTVENEIGCQANDEMLVFAIRNVFYPTAFSPNDDGINDRFYLQTKNGLDVKSFQVFDRWGGLVFENENAKTNDEQAGWDGKARALPCQSGAYAWFAEVVFPDGATVLYKGEVMLIR